jgi:FkbM family methyltransferase
MHGWGQVIAIEAQERVYYALAGNIAINNCFNARAMLAAVGNQSGVLRIPRPDYL